MRYQVLVAFLVLVGCKSSESTPPHYDIGVVHREVSTESAEAQLWFDRGLAMCFGFNHEEAVVCFDRAMEADPDCVMAYWGKAYALGPNYNSPGVSEDVSQIALAAVAEARTRFENGAILERALIEAVATRFASPAPADRSALDAAYEEAMSALYVAHPDDADVAALAAEARMQLRPWKLWSPEGIAAPETPGIRAILEPAIARWPDHPALCHLYIHTMEAGPEVAAAVPAAMSLEALVPGSGHLLHMPSHIYTWTGKYADVIRVNLEAVEADHAFVDHAGRNNFFTLYRLHNLHFVAYGGMFEGRRKLAMSAARELVDEIPAGLLAAIPDLLDIFTATPLHVMVRFGLWEEILAEPEPVGELHAARAVWRYARGVALASLGRVEEAEAEQVDFLAARAAVPDSRVLFNNSVKEILSVAENVLAGEIEYRRGNYDAAFALLRKAVELDELLNYDEPWGWMEPARHALGALLTAQERYAEAVEVYRRNLERYPNNGWALHGLAECLERLGKVAEADGARSGFVEAWARADTAIPGSCFCRVDP